MPCEQPRRGDAAGGESEAPDQRGECDLCGSTGWPAEAMGLYLPGCASCQDWDSMLEEYHETGDLNAAISRHYVHPNGAGDVPEIVRMALVDGGFIRSVPRPPGGGQTGAKHHRDGERGDGASDADEHTCVETYAGLRVNGAKVIARLEPVYDGDGDDGGDDLGDLR